MTEEQFNQIDNNSYSVGEFQIYTMPLVKPGYLVEDAEFGQMIFVNSKLPEDERAKVVEGLIEKLSGEQTSGRCSPL